MTSAHQLDDQGRLADATRVATRLREAIGAVIVGQRRMIDRLLIGLLTDGHVLLQGVPGLAKTLAVKTLADSVEARFSRVQFTPDLLPADVIGTQVFNPKSQTFEPHLGPIFANLVLADEINRAPAKVQSALLEAMQEKQVTIGDRAYALPNPFLVLATQNPIEQEGTYALAEAQADRFMLHVRVDYPTKREERMMMDRIGQGEQPQTQPVVSLSELVAAKSQVKDVYIDDKLKDYIVELVFASREPAKAKLEDLVPMIELGASPRATLALESTSKAHALLEGRAFVTPEDIKAVGPDVLRHRIKLSYEAEAEEIRVEDVVRRLFESVPIP